MINDHVVFPDFGALSGKIVFMVNIKIVAFCETLFQIVRIFQPSFIKIHHIIRYKHTPRTTSSTVFYNFSKSLVVSEIWKKNLFHRGFTPAQLKLIRSNFLLWKGLEAHNMPHGVNSSGVEIIDQFYCNN